MYFVHLVYESFSSCHGFFMSFGEFVVLYNIFSFIICFFYFCEVHDVGGIVNQWVKLCMYVGT